MTSNPTTREWLIDVTVGVLFGGVVGAIVAVNIAIFFGPDQGYQSSIGDVFSHNAIAGVAVVVALVSGPVIGVVLMRELRRRRLL